MIQKRVLSGKNFEIEKAIEFDSALQNKSPYFYYISSGIKKSFGRRKEYEKGSIIDFTKSIINGNIESIGLISSAKHDLIDSNGIKREVKKCNSNELKNGITYTELAAIKTHSQLDSISKEISPRKYNKAIKDLIESKYNTLLSIGEYILESSDFIIFSDKEIPSNMIRIIPEIIKPGWSGYNRITFVIYLK